MAFLWKTTPQLPPPVPPIVIPSDAVSFEVALVANTVNVGGALSYNTPNVAYDVVYELPSINVTNSTFATLNTTFANIGSATIGTLNVSFASINVASFGSLNVAAANISIFYSPNVITGNVSADPTGPLGIASKAYADARAAGGSGTSANTGQIERFPFTPPSNGWIEILQQDVSRNTYSALFNVLSTYYGDGDGSTTFGLPVQYEPIESMSGVEWAQLPAQRTHATIERISDGRLVLLGGIAAAGISSNTFFGEVFSSGNVIWQQANNIPQGTSQHSSCILNDGRLLIAGGIATGSSPVTTTVLGNIAGNNITWTNSTALPVPLHSLSMSTLNDGKVLVVGGVDGSSTVVQTAYIGNVSGTSITWTTATVMPHARFNHKQMTLTDGRVLVTGGAGPTPGFVTSANSYFGNVVNTTVITWTQGSNMPVERFGHQNTLLSDDRILLTGGANLTSIASNTSHLGTISGTTITWVSSGTIPIALFYHQTKFLLDGRVMILGGAQATGVHCFFGTISGDTISWIPLSRFIGSITKLSDGRLLSVGGLDVSSVPSHETFFGTLTSNTVNWVSGTALPVDRRFHQTVLLPDGRVLLVGGQDGALVASPNTYFGNISSNTITWTAGTDLLGGKKFSHTLTSLADGRVLVVAGSNGTTANAQTFFGSIIGTTINWAAGTPLPTVGADIGRRFGHATTQLRDGRIMVSGGRGDPDGGRSNVFLGTISSNTITWADGTALPILTGTGLFEHGQTLLPDARVYVTGGHDFSNGPKPETFFGEVTGNTILWRQATPFPYKRRSPMPTLHANGTIVFVGGQDGTTVRGEIYIAKMLLVGIKT